MSDAVLSPGLHSDIPAARYHADDLCAVPTLSSSIAKTILNKTPRHAWIEHPRLNKDFEASDDSKFDLGAVAHEVILGRGGGFAVLDYPNWATKAAKEDRDAVRRIGKTPILKEQFERAEEMAASVWSEIPSIAGCDGLFEARRGDAEVVGIWKDHGGPLCRMMLDWIGPTQTDIWDLKTTGQDLSDASLARVVENLGYDLSAAFYLRGMQTLFPDLAGRFRWHWVFVEDAPPYELRVVEIDSEQLMRGHRKAAIAIARWHRCMLDHEWPGYPRQITRVTPPAWAEAQWIERELKDPDFDDAVLLDRAPPSAPTSPDSMIFGEDRIHLGTEP